jgi:hypothetical protein
MSENKIVKLSEYDLAIDANLAKTKLDAYGVPCYLTHEHMANLYPMGTSFGISVALMVFESDLTLAKTILDERVEET